MHYLKNPISIQFELSNVCQALCLGCSRTLIDYDKLKTMQTPVTIDQVPVKSAFEGKQKVYLKLDALKNALTPNLMESIKDVYFIGTVDDPFAHPQLVEYIEWLVTTHPQVYFCLHTNGGLRTPEYFKELALVLKKHNNYKIWFSIDGLENTNHYYRKRVQWLKIMANAEAFINSGGKAGWQYLIFPWNKHQIYEARELAKKMGFRNFKERWNRRTDLNNNSFSYRQKQKIENKHNFQNPSEYEVHCGWAHNLKQYHVGHDGKLWPCCYLDNYRRMGLHEGEEGDINWENRFSIYEDGWNDLYTKTADEILEHRFFKEDIVDSWSSNKHGLDYKDRIYKCTTTCSKKHQLKQGTFVPASNNKKVTRL